MTPHALTPQERGDLAYVIDMCAGALGEPQIMGDDRDRILDMIAQASALAFFKPVVEANHALAFRIGQLEEQVAQMQRERATTN
jgi:hypothetical protein